MGALIRIAVAGLALWAAGCSTVTPFNTAPAVANSAPPHTSPAGRSRRSRPRPTSSIGRGSRWRTSGSRPTPPAQGRPGDAPRRQDGDGPHARSSASSPRVRARSSPPGSARSADEPLSLRLPRPPGGEARARRQAGRGRRRRRPAVPRPTGPPRYPARSSRPSKKAAIATRSPQSDGRAGPTVNEPRISSGLAPSPTVTRNEIVLPGGGTTEPGACLPVRRPPRSVPVWGRGPGPEGSRSSSL